MGARAVATGTFAAVVLMVFMASLAAVRGVEHHNGRMLAGEEAFLYMLAFLGVFSACIFMVIMLTLVVMDWIYRGK